MPKLLFHFLSVRYNANIYVNEVIISFQYKLNLLLCNVPVVKFVTKSVLRNYLSKIMNIKKNIKSMTKMIVINQRKTKIMELKWMSIYM